MYRFQIDVRGVMRQLLLRTSVRGVWRRLGAYQSAPCARLFPYKFGPQVEGVVVIVIIWSSTGFEWEEEPRVQSNAAGKIGYLIVYQL